MGNAVLARKTLSKSIVSVPPLGGSIGLHPAIFDDQIGGFRLIDEDIVLGHGVLDQRRIGAGNRGMPDGCGIIPVATKERRNLRQGREAITDIDPVVQ